jgi:hypothetical protein
MPSDAPNSRFPHMYVVLRFDRGGPTYEESDVMVVSAFGTRADAEEEAARVGALNEARGFRYVVRSVRVKSADPNEHDA